MAMIEELTKRYFQKLPEFREYLTIQHPENYKALVKLVVSILTDRDDVEYDTRLPMDPELIHEIDDGHYQGTLVYVIGEKGYQPSKYWYCRISYGSCSGCDTLEGIRGYSDEKPVESEINEYMQLICHIVQNIRPMHGDLC